MENHLPLTELAYLAEALKGQDASQGNGELVFALPPEAASSEGKGSIDFPNTSNPNDLKNWATVRTAGGRLPQLLAEARNETEKLQGDRRGISHRLIAVLEAHVREGMGAPIDLATTHLEVFGFDLTAVDPSTAIAAQREILAPLVGAAPDEALYLPAMRLQNQFKKFNAPEDVGPDVEATLQRCITAADNLIDSMNFPADKTQAIKDKVRKIKTELREKVPYSGKASLQGELVKIVLRPQAEIASQQLTVIHEFTHALQIIMRQLGFDEGTLHFEDFISIAGAGAVALDEGLADLHSHNVLQGYLPNQKLLNPANDVAAQHWAASFLRRQILRTCMAAAVQNSATPESLEKLILDQGFSPAAAGFYLATVRAETQTSNRLYSPAYYYGGKLFRTRWSKDPQRTVREFLHMEGPADYRSLSSK